MRIVRTFFFLLFAGLLLTVPTVHALVMTFGSGSDISPVSYSEAGLTVSADPFSPDFFEHLHIQNLDGIDGRELQAHNFQSEPYVFTMGGASFDLLGFDIVDGIADIESGMWQISSSSAAIQSVSPTAYGSFIPGTGFTNITSWTLGLPPIGGGIITLDNIQFQPTAAPEPTTLLLLGLGLAGLGFARKRLH